MSRVRSHPHPACDHLLEKDWQQYPLPGEKGWLRENLFTFKIKLSSR